MLKTPTVREFVIKYAHRTTPANSFLFHDPGELRDKEFEATLAWLHKTTTNYLSSAYGDGALDHVLGLPTVEQEFILGYTCEKGPMVPQTKIRIMLATPELLEFVYRHPTAVPRFLKASHAPRW